MNAAKHTPAPWHLGLTGLVVYAADGAEVANTMVLHGLHGGQEGARANAKLIVLAVNAHEALVDALTKAHDHLNYCGYGRDAWERDGARGLDSEIEAALKLARGES